MKKHLIKKTNVKKPMPLLDKELSEFYDNAFRAGIRAAINTANGWMGQKQTSEAVERVVNVICEVQK